MKKFLVTILLSLIPMAALAQELPKIPAQGMCHMLNGNQEENDLCDEWADTLTSSEALRLSGPGESGIVFIVMVNYDEPSGLTSASFTQLWRMPGLGGMIMIIWQTFIVDEYDAAVSVQSEKFNESMGVFPEWFKQASEIFSNICPPCDGGRKKMPVTASVTN